MYSNLPRKYGNLPAMDLNLPRKYGNLPAKY
jgi:hypothetical protein